MGSVNAVLGSHSYAISEKYVHYYGVTRDTYYEILPLFLTTANNPSVDSLRVFVVSARSLMSQEDRLSAILWFCIPTLLLPIVIFFLIFLHFNAPIKTLKVRPPVTMGTVQSTIIPSKSDQQIQRENSKAKMQSFASNVVWVHTLCNVYMLIKHTVTFPVEGIRLVLRFSYVSVSYPTQAMEIAATDKSGGASPVNSLSTSARNKSLPPSPTIPENSHMKQERLPSIDTSVTRDSADFDSWSVQR